MTLQSILSQPISWMDWDTDAELLAFLSDLQANILKGHGRDHTANIFLSFDGMSAAAIKLFLKNISFLTTSALEQLRSAAAFKLTDVSGGRIVCVFLGRGAYAKLNGPASETPPDPAYRAGMVARGQLPTISFTIGGNTFPVPGINDTKRNQWEGAGAWKPGNAEPDCMILVADDNYDMVTAGVKAVQKVINNSGAKQLGIDRGLAQRRFQGPDADPKGEGLEHFGYIDGRSQPLFLVEDIAGEAKQNWDPAFPPSQFIVPDPAGCTPVSAGSYFVYRKLEQNVKAFKEEEESLEAAFSPTIGERAGALVVGRFEDGTPTVFNTANGNGGAPVNDFNYDNDNPTNKKLAKCPFKAHVRKTNPRDVPSRIRLMARRGITYGNRKPRPPGADFPINDRPEHGVGLLFMAYMSNISEQFEFTQCAWAGNVDFEHADTGIDGVIGQQPNTAGTGHVEWHDSVSGQNATHDFKTHVKLVGGEYMFAPAISFLQRG